MNKITASTVNAIKSKTPFAHGANPAAEGLNEAQIKGLFYKAITDTSDSVISEINRIVTEGNTQLAELSAAFGIGRVDICPLEGVKEQTLIPCGCLLRVAGEVQTYTAEELTTSPLSSFGFTQAGKYLFLKVTAPPDVVPDDNITVECGDFSNTGLTVLSNTLQEALDGNYYLYYGIHVGLISSIQFAVRWNNTSSGRVLIDFSDTFLGATNMGLYIRYSISSSGYNMSASWAAGKKYIGFYVGTQASTNSADYTWARFVPDVNESSQKTVTLSNDGWNNNLRQTVSVLGLTVNHSVVVSPNPACINAWCESGVYCISQGENQLTFACAKRPTSSLTANLLVGA